MPKVHRTCPQCGDSMTLILGGNRKSAESKADWMLDKGHVCDSCQQANYEAENAKAAEANKDLPELHGSEKQVAWAETIRRQRMDMVASAISTLDGLDTIETARKAVSEGAMLPKLLINDTVQVFQVPNSDVGLSQLKAIITAFKSVLGEQVKASWWIDSRNASSSWLLGQLKEPIAKRLAAPVTHVQAELERDVLAEATVYPAEPVSKVVAVVTATDKAVTVSYPEKDETLRKLVKWLGFIWSDGVWALKLNAMHGQPVDRVAEVAHALLSAGFPVRVLDDDARAKAINGAFEPRWPRWIAMAVAGKFYGRLVISFSEDDDLLADVRSLPGAKGDYYKPRTWYVRPCEWQALRDFAQLHDFRITPTAEQALDDAEHKEKSALLGVEVCAAPKSRPVSKPVMPEMEDGIADELRDDE